MEPEQLPPPGDVHAGDVYEGQCLDGPLDGQRVTCRFPAGFVLADRPAGTAWIYDRRDDGRFVLRASPDRPAAPAGRDLDPEKIIAAALGEEYDVIAAPSRIGRPPARRGHGKG